MNWNEVIGQEDAQQRLTQLLQQGRVPHALLLCGPSGCGKMAVALAFASQLLIEGYTPPKENTLLLDAGDSDDVTNSSVRSACEDFRRRQEAMLRDWNHPDLHFSFPTIKLKKMSSDHQPVSDDFTKEWHELLSQGPYFTMDQWMRQMGAANQQAIITAAESDELARKLALKSSQGGYKVALIWLPERMNLASANKILKLLEEPPAQTVFLMVSEEPEKLLETIRSRTQRLTLKQLKEEDIRNALIRNRAIDEESARYVARVAHGSWLRALDILDTGNENRQFLDMFKMLMRLAYMRDVKELKKWTEAVALYGREKQRRMLVYFIQQIRENFIYNFHNPALNYQTEEEEDFSKHFAPFINECNIIEIIELLELANRDIGQNANAKIVFYDLALKMIVLVLKGK